MTDTAPTEQAPLKEVSLRFPDGSVGPDSKPTGGLFDGNDEKSEPFSYLTRRDEYEPPIPEPPQREIEQAARNGIDKKTGLTTQPRWLSVLKKRQPPWFFVRWALCNCFCNPRFTMTRAQWIWFVHVVCLGLHVYYGYTLYEKAMDKEASAMEVTVWRMTPVWNASATDGYTADMVDNLHPIRFDFVVLCIYLFSAGFHLFSVALGPFDRWIWIYWRQLDLAFHWWRQLSLMATLPLIMMVVCCISHFREQNHIAVCFVLTFLYVAGFFLTELWSRPHRNADRSYDMNRWLGDEAPIKPGLPWTRLAPEEIAQRALQQSRRRMNYIIRLIPMLFGLIPFITVWVVVLNNFFVQLESLRIETTDDLYKRIPDWVPMIVIGSLFFMACYIFPMMWWQWAPPMYYWKTEIFFSLWTLAFKGALWYILNTQFFDAATFNLALALDQNTTDVVTPGITTITTVTTTVDTTASSVTTTVTE